jgi:hypothetical protein
MPEQSAQAQPKSSSSSGNKTLIIVIVVVVALGILGGAGYYLQQRSSEKTAEKTAEKAIEDATGGDAKVDISEGGDKVTIETDEGKITTSETSIPDSFPSSITVYQGSEVAGSTEAEEGVTLLLKTSDSTSQAFSFYKSDLAKNGWEISSSSTIEGSSLITAEKGNEGVLVTITTDEEDGKTAIAIVYSTGK